MAGAKKKKTGKAASDEDIPFEEAMEKLEEVVHMLEGNDVPLEESLAAYERGVGLVRHLHGRLDGVQRKIEELAASEGGLPVLSDITSEVDIDTDGVDADGIDSDDLESDL